MVKVTINGTVYSFDNERYPLAEAIELEEQLGMPFGEWRGTALGAGSARALAGFVWLVLKRNGQDVPLADIISGKFELAESDIRVEAEGGDPTAAPSGPPGPSTSQPSPKSSGSGPGSGSTSPSVTSTSSSGT